MKTQCELRLLEALASEIMAWKDFRNAEISERDARRAYAEAMEAELHIELSRVKHDYPESFAVRTVGEYLAWRFGDEEV